MCCENKRTDQLCSYCTADLHLFFRIGKTLVFSRECLIMIKCFSTDCDENCLMCTSPTKCTKCVPSMLLYQGLCVAHCGQGQFEDGATLSCKGECWDSILADLLSLFCEWLIHRIWGSLTVTFKAKGQTAP